jgi:phytoene dehydrogenase-like protein
MPVSDKFDELKQRIEQADQEIKAAAAQDEAELNAAVKKARKSADDRAAELRERSTETSDKTKRQWLEAQSDWEKHIKHIRARMDEKKTELDAVMAADDAHDAEEDAMDAIDYAKSAVAEAEYAVLDALRLEKQAETLKQSMAHST